MDKIKIILVDDHDIIRDGIKALLILSKDIEVIGEAGNSEELFELLKETKPDVLILDIELPTLSGLEIANIIQENFSDIKTLILSAKNDENTIFEAINAGVLGILPKTVKSKELTDAIYKVNSGEQFYSDYIADLMIKSYINKSKISKKFEEKKEAELSAREIEVIRCFTDGMIYKEIADKLNISVRTVESHKLNILKKLELKTIIDLVKYAIKNNIVEL